MNTLLIQSFIVQIFVSSSSYNIFLIYYLVKMVKAGQTAAFALKKVKRSALRYCIDNPNQSGCVLYFYLSSMLILFSLWILFLLRKGMVLVDPALKPQACREFQAEILVLYHSTTISTNYQAVIHCGVAQQTAKVLLVSYPYQYVEPKNQFINVLWLCLLLSDIH